MDSGHGSLGVVPSSDEHLTFENLQELLKVLVDEMDEMQREFDVKRQFIMERQRIITNNGNQLSTIGQSIDILKASMESVEHQIALQEQFLRQLETLFIQPMIAFTTKMICKCPQCEQQSSEVKRILSTLESLDIGVQAIYELMERVTYHRNILLNQTTVILQPYHVIGQILEAHCKNLAFVEKCMQEMVSKIVIINEIFPKIGETCTAGIGV